MAIVSVAGPAFDLRFSDLDLSSFTSVSSATATGFSLNFNDGSRWDVAGSGLVYGGPNGLPTAGTISSIDFVEPGDVVSGSVLGSTLTAASFSGFVSASDEPGFIDALLAGNDVLVGGNNTDEMSSSAGADVLAGHGGSDTLQGEATGDLLEGGDGDDSIYGGAGEDVARGGGGNDTVDAGEGNDYAAGEVGSDTLGAGAGEDWLEGGEGADRLVGGAGDDVLQGADGGDLLEAGGGDDILLGDDTAGGAGSDTLYGGDGNDLALGGGGSDSLYGSAGDDLLAGGTGTDFLEGGAGNDLLQGDGGSDTVSFSGAVTVIGSSGDAVTVDAGAEGIDTLIGIEAVLEGQRLQFDLGTLDPSQGFVIQGDAADDHAGFRVSGGGDINGDGFDDVIVGAHYGDDAGNRAGETYVVFGGPGSLGSPMLGDGGVRLVVDLGSLGTAQGFVITGESAYDYAGYSISLAGDVNGDGFDDLVIGAFGADSDGYNAGNAYVVFGAAGGIGTPTTTDGVVRQVLDLASLSSAQGFIVQGDASFDVAGASVAGAGDINGDGFDDLVIGAPDGGAGGLSAGEAYVVFGSPDPIGAAVTADGVVRQLLDLTSLQSAQGFVIRGDTDFDRTGVRVSSAGDINGDGFADIIVGAPLGDDGGYGAGEAYVLLGAASGFGTPVTTAGVVRQVIDLTSLGAAQGFVIQGDSSLDSAGARVASAGDINGDGYDDLMVAAPGADHGGDRTGDVYVLLGGPAAFGVPVSAAGAVRQVLDLASFGTAQGFVIQGADPVDLAAGAVAAAGDIDGDGLGDLLLGVASGENGEPGSGEVYVVFGAAAGLGDLVTVDGVARFVLDLGSLEMGQGFVTRGDAAYDYAGSDVAAAGDIDGDGFDDLIIGAPYGDDGGQNAGEAYVLFGAPVGGAAPMVLAGDAGANILIGNRADDTLSGGGGADVFRGGAGNDSFVLPDFGFADIDGGSGIDSVVVQGTGLTLDLASELPEEITSIERIDLTGSGNNTVLLDARAFFDLTEERGIGDPALRIDGNVGDTMQMGAGADSFSLAGSTVLGANTYNRWVCDPDGAGPLPTNSTAELWIDQDVTAIFL